MSNRTAKWVELSAWLVLAVVATGAACWLYGCTPRRTEPVLRAAVPGPWVEPFRPETGPLPPPPQCEEARNCICWDADLDGDGDGDLDDYAEAQRLVGTPALVPWLEGVSR